MSEETDALVIAVSEETTTISVAGNSRLWSSISPLQLREMIAGRPLAEVAREAGLAARV